MARNRTEILNYISQQLKKDTDFGVIPGTDKPTLLQPGAQKICSLVNAYPDTEITVHELGNGHREYRAKTTLKLMGSGIVLATGPGSCSTMESKYRYRNAPAEDTGNPVPGKYWDLKKAGKMAEAQELLGGKGFKASKNESGNWSIHKATGSKVDNPDIADLSNTCLKMASKRSLIAATLNLSGGWTEHFTQDLEDMRHIIDAETSYQAPPAQQTQQQDKPASKPATTKTKAKAEPAPVNRAPQVQPYINKALAGGLTQPEILELLGRACLAHGNERFNELTDDQFQAAMGDFSQEVAAIIEERSIMGQGDADEPMTVEGEIV